MLFMRVVYQALFASRTSIDGEYLVCFLDDPGPIKLPLSYGSLHDFDRTGSRFLVSLNSVGVDHLHTGLKVT